MELLVVVHDFVPAVGGSETLLRRVGEGLVARGHRVDVVTSTALGAEDFVRAREAPLSAGSGTVGALPVIRLPYRRPSPVVRAVRDVLAAWWWRRRWPGHGRIKCRWAGPRLRHLASAGDLPADLVLGATAPFETLFVAERLARRRRVPLALLPCLHPGDPWLLDNPALHELFRRADLVLALTGWEERLLRALGVRRERVAVTGGGTDPDEASAPRRDVRSEHGIGPDEPLVLFFGRKERGKGIGDILTASSSLWQGGRSFRLALVGAATDHSRGALARRIAGLPEEARARIAVRDDVDDEERRGWLAAADVLVHPSRIDSLGLVFLEAWTFATPVVAARTGPQTELVTDGETGRLAAPGDSRDLARVLGELLGDPEGARRMGASGRKRVRDGLTWTHATDRWEAAFQRCRP